VVEAVTALPLVLPPTVLGFYLLVLLSPNGTLGGAWLSVTGTTLTFSFLGLIIASVLYSLPFMVQPLQAAFEAIGRGPMEAAASLRAQGPGCVLHRGHAHGRAGLSDRDRADLCPYDRRIRRGADGGRQHSRPDQGRVDPDLRICRDDQL
jgi:hypothetical protein